MKVVLPTMRLHGMVTPCKLIFGKKLNYYYQNLKIGDT